MMNKEIEQAIEALRVGIRNAQVGNRHHCIGKGGVDGSWRVISPMQRT